MLTHAEVRATMDTVPDVPRTRAKRCHHAPAMLAFPPHVDKMGEPLAWILCRCGHRWRRLGQPPGRAW